MNGWLTIKTKLLTGPIKTGLKEINNAVESAGQSAKGMALSFGKIALLIGVITTALAFLSGGFQTLLGENQELNSQVESIKNAFSRLGEVVAIIVAPVIETIVNWIYKMMSYLNVITKEFFGIDLFAKKTDASMKNTAKSLKSGSKSAKEIHKQLAGFDEMNVLGKQTATSGGVGGGGGTEPKDKKDKPKPPDTTKWQEFIKKVKDQMAKLKKQVVDTWNFILKTDHDEAVKLIRQQGGAWADLKIGLFDWLHGIANIIDGFYTYWKGVFTIIVGLITGNKEKVVDGFRKIGEGIKKVIVDGLISFIRSIPEMIMGVIKGLKTTIVNFVSDKIINPIIEKIKKIPTTIKDAFKDGLWNALLSLIKKGANKIIDKLNDIFSISIGKYSSALLNGLGINVSPGKYQLLHIPRLAKGGIVNNPGRGVNMGSYIAGEKGAEAVIPLTDDTLQRLASMIPITIDLTNTIDGRVLNRRLETIKANDRFATGR